MITKDKTGEKFPHLQIAEVALVHCNVVKNDYQRNSRFLCTSVPNNPFCKLLVRSPKNFIFLKTFNSEIKCIKAWFTDQHSKPLEIEDNITFVIN